MADATINDLHFYFLTDETSIVKDVYFRRIGNIVCQKLDAAQVVRVYIWVRGIFLKSSGDEYCNGEADADPSMPSPSSQSSLDMHDDRQMKRGNGNTNSYRRA